MKMQDYKNIDEYVKNFPPDVQKILQNVRQTILKVVPEAEETIRYGIPTIRFQNKNLVHFAAYDTHIGFYPGAAGVAAFKRDIAKYNTSKGTIQFPLDSVPLDLIRRITEFCVKQRQAK